jgi:hypothetical protein
LDRGKNILLLFHVIEVCCEVFFFDEFDREKDLENFAKKLLDRAEQQF